MHSLGLIFCITLAGALGGFAHALVAEEPHAIWPFQGANTSKVNQALADTVLGVAAAWAVFLISDLFGLDSDAIDLKKDLVKLMALGVVSGYAGVRLLNPMSARIGRRIEEAEKHLQERIKQLEKEQHHATEQMSEVNKNIKAGGEVNRYRQLLAEASAYERVEAFGPALEKIDEVLVTRADDEDALLKKAKYLKRNAQREKDGNLTGALKEAINITSSILDRNPQSSRAFYNRACYKCLLKHELDEVIKDLRKAIELDSIFKISAGHDADFTDIRNKAAFKKLIK